MIETVVVDTYSINKKNVQGLMVVVKPTPEMLEEDMVGVHFDFAMPGGQVLEAAIDKCLGFEGNLHLFFSRLTKAFKPIGFSDPNEENIFTFDTNTVA